MALIKDLNVEEINLIVSLLKKDNFKDIKVNKKYISFSTDGNYRNFELYGTELSDLTHNINLDAILKDQYKEKVRFSNSIQYDLEDSDQYNLENCIAKQEWKIVNVIDKHSLLKDSQGDIFFEDIFEVEITNEPHFILNEHVYEGQFDSILKLSSIPIIELLKNTNILNFLKLKKD